ncbi:1-phosphatidylinositol 45-bisphosphate phosphodiesterase gamma plc-3, partial [Dissostichus eleginoides]
VKEWVQKLKGSSGVTWRVDVTRPRLGKRVLFKASYKCQHRVNPRAAKSKEHLLSSKNAHDTQEYSWGNEVILINRHNHNLFVHRDVGEKANNILTGLFGIGHTPTSALAVLKHDLQMEYGQRYVYVSANREICPDLPYVQRLFHKVCREEYGTRTGPTMLAALKLQKVHQLKHSGELCFIDSSGNMDRENCRVFLLLTHSCAGGLPLGILLCQSEDEQTIAQGLEQLKQVVGEKGFAGRGHEGPQLQFGGGCGARRVGSLTETAALFAIVKEMLYCQEIGSVDRLYSEARGHPVAASYEKFLRYLDRLYARRECWALSYRGSFLTRGNHTNNFAEAAMRVLKDKILQRTKAFNLPQLFDLLTSRLETYYEARIVDVCGEGIYPNNKPSPPEVSLVIGHKKISHQMTSLLWIT